MYHKTNMKNRGKRGLGYANENDTLAPCGFVSAMRVERKDVATFHD